MLATAVTYGLLVLDVLVVAILIQLIVFGPVWLLRRRAAPVPAAHRAAGFGAAARKRRCDDCRSGWVGSPGSDASLFILRRRRAARRRARAKARPAPAWAVRQGWDRCPSCFSTNVRDSRRQEFAAR
jgi:hypothetical protein